IKRGDFHALTDDDVVYAQNLEEVNQHLAYYQKNKINKMVLQKHVEGPIIKFYGVQNRFFHHRVMTSKDPHKKEVHYPNEWWQKINVEAIRAIAFKKAGILGLSIFGGDCIIDQNGKLWVIDMNDWPSFRTCQEEAAKAMGHLALDALSDKVKSLGMETGIACQPLTT
ncbi:MAG: hypothetical protein WCG27_03195, partial [Pseudomonadota bacterium]